MGLLVRFLLQSFSPSLEVVLYKKIECQSKRCPLNFLCSKNFQGWLLKIFNGWIFFHGFKFCKIFTPVFTGNFYWQILHGTLFASRVFCPDFFTCRNWNFHRKKKMKLCETLVRMIAWFSFKGTMVVLLALH